MKRLLLVLSAMFACSAHGAPAATTLSAVIAPGYVSDAPFATNNGAPTITGCTVSSETSGPTAGSFVLASACTTTITLTMPQAPNGWACEATVWGGTNFGGFSPESAYTSTSVSFNVTAPYSGSTVTFFCMGF